MASMQRDDHGTPEPGLHLSLTIRGDQIEVPYAAPIRHAPRAALRAPLLTLDATGRLRHPTSELVALVLDANGHVLDEFGWPLAAEEFFDRQSPQVESALIGTPVRVVDGLRIWRVPIVHGARIFYIVRSDALPGAAPGQGLEFQQRGLAMFWIGPPMGHLPPLPVPWPHPPEPSPLPLPGAPGPVLQPPSQRRAPIRLPRGGRIVDVVPIIQNGPIDRCFNIVVVGDGFTASELDDYDTRVRILFGGPAPTPSLVAGYPDEALLPPTRTDPAYVGLGFMEPFASVWDKINVWSVRTESDDSGITIPGCSHADCQQPCARQTYYRVSGCFRGKPYPGYVGIADHDELTLRDAVTAAGIPYEYGHLFIVIANIALYGGSAFPHRRLAMATMWNPARMAEWVQLVAHECAHAIAHVAEERIVCEPKDPMEVYLNQAYATEVDANNVPWQGLLDTHEHVNGHMRAVHRFGGLIDAVSGQPVLVPASHYAMLGAFWGCQNVETGTVVDPNHVCNSYSELDAKNFFRPMAECRMRALRYGFCRVCRHLITERILAHCV
jgi:hypothetical protein